MDDIDLSECDSDQLADSDPKIAIKKPFSKPGLMLEDSGSLQGHARLSGIQVNHNQSGRSSTDGNQNLAESTEFGSHGIIIHKEGYEIGTSGMKDIKSG